MKWVVMIIFFFLSASCKKSQCKIVTVRVINGCSNPVNTTYIVQDKEYCGDELEEVRKLAKKQEVDLGGGIKCYITTIVTEE